MGTSAMMRQGGWKWWALYAALWLPLLSINLAAFVAFGSPLNLAIRNVVAHIVPGAVLGPLILGLPRRLPWPEGRKGRFFGLQALVLVLFMMASTAGWVLLVAIDHLVFEHSFMEEMSFRALPWRLANDLLVYGTLAGLAYAWQNAARGRELAARASRAEALRARAQLEAMRNQLNPHFILNTFHALIGLVRRDPPVAEEALERLGDLLRYSLRLQREGLDEVSLRDEWSFVQSYLDLERLRLGDRLMTRFDVAPDTLDCRVPSFALQTLVENAVRHAVAPRAEGGRLTVSAEEVEGRLRIRVQDDGPGMSAAPAGDHQGVGLNLLRERLAALHGKNARLDIESLAGGIRATLDLPVRDGMEEA